MLKRRVFTREFKVEAVSMVSQKGLSVAEASRRFGGWAEPAAEVAGAVFGGRLEGNCGNVSADGMGGEELSSAGQE